MKKIVTLLVQIILLTIVISCGSENQPKAKVALTEEEKINIIDSIIDEVECACAKDFKYILNQTEADPMIKDFEAIYSPTKDGLQYSYWVDDCFISEMNYTLYNKYPTTDGVRIWFGAEADGPKKSGIFIVPTTPNPRPTPRDKYVDEWNYFLPAPPQSCTPSFPNYGNDYNRNAKGRITEYKTSYVDASVRNGKQLSEAVWFDKCVIDCIDRLLKALPDSMGINGVILYNAAYKSRLTEGQVHDEQSTLVIVFGKNDGTSSVPDWTITDRINEKKFAGAGFNHGSLCPQICQ